MGRIFVIAMLLSLFLAPSAEANPQSFKAWLSDFKAEAQRAGISQRVLEAALPDTLQPIESVIRLDRKQPESTTKYEDYVTNVVTPRVQKGRGKLSNYRTLLNSVSESYGVEPQVIVALWGVETNFGQNTGGYEVPHALATLAYDGRRGAYFREELLKALKIIEEGHAQPGKMKGSWAGAMGQCQFMPSSFIRFAQDHNKDGRRDIWTTEGDVFASAANYLSSSGWKKGEPWGRKVKLPAGFDRGTLGIENKHSLQYWHDKGLRMADGKAIPFEGAYQASVIQPGGPGTSAFIVYDNYRTIMKWNKSHYFATSVGLLSDQIRG